MNKFTRYQADKEHIKDLLPLQWDKLPFKDKRIEYRHAKARVMAYKIRNNIK